MRFDGNNFCHQPQPQGFFLPKIVKKRGSQSDFPDYPKSLRKTKDYNKNFYNIFTDGGFKLTKSNVEIASAAIYCVKSDRKWGKIIKEEANKSSFLAETVAIIGAL